MFNMTVSPDALKQAVDLNIEKQTKAASDQFLKLINERLTERIDALKQGMRIERPDICTIQLGSGSLTTDTDQRGLALAIETLKLQGFDVSFQTTSREPYDDYHVVTVKV